MIFISQGDFVSKNKDEVANTLLRLGQFNACSEICKKNLFNLPYKNTVSDPILDYIYKDFFTIDSDDNRNIILQMVTLANILHPFDLKDDNGSSKYSLFFDYYIRNFVAKFGVLDSVKKILYPLMTTRVDIKNKGDKNSIEVVKCNDKESKIIFPEWCVDKTGNGLVFESNSSDVEIIIKCIKDGRLFLSFKGVDFKDSDGKRVDVFVGYKNIKIIDVDNNIKYFCDDLVRVSHDNGKDVSFVVKDGDIFTISYTAFVSPLPKEKIIEIIDSTFPSVGNVDILNV